MGSYSAQRTATAAAHLNILRSSKEKRGLKTTSNFQARDVQDAQVPLRTWMVPERPRRDGFLAMLVTPAGRLRRLSELTLLGSNSGVRMFSRAT